MCVALDSFVVYRKYSGCVSNHIQLLSVLYKYIEIYFKWLLDKASSERDMGIDMRTFWTGTTACILLSVWRDKLNIQIDFCIYCLHFLDAVCLLCIYEIILRKLSTNLVIRAFDR